MGVSFTFLKKRHKILYTLVKDKEILSHSVGLSLSQPSELKSVNLMEIYEAKFTLMKASKVALSWRQKKREKRTKDIK